MNAINEHRAGYRKTKLGWLPEEWEVVKLGEVVKLMSGGTPSRQNPTYWNGDIPWLTTSLINFSEIKTAEEYITQEGLMNSSAKLFPTGTILIAMYGQGKTRGRAAIIGVEAATNQACAGILVGEKTSRDYLYYFFEKNYGSIRNFSQGGNQANLSLGLIRSIKIPLPPLPEQERIAEVLGTWDAVLERQRELIGALEERNRGLAQDLLTGRRRLPGVGRESVNNVETRYGPYPSDWENLPIGVLGSEVKRRNSQHLKLPVLSCSKHKGLVDSLRYFGKQIYSDDTSPYKIVQRGEFAYATNHIEEGSIGYQDLYENALISPMYTAFKVHGIDHDYLFRLLKTDLLIHLYRINTSSSVNRRGSLRWKEFSKIKIWVPPTIKEQQAIAGVLATADAEVTRERERLAELAEQKRGLMGDLLRGVKRVGKPKQKIT